MTPKETDSIIESLLAKTCPLHKIAMPEIDPFFSPPDYVRHRFRCTSHGCGCEADFVGDEIKPDSIARTLHWIFYYELDSKLLPLHLLDTSAINCTDKST